MYKKWICGALLILVLGIGILIYRNANMGVEDYIKIAERMEQSGSYDQMIYELEKALEKSIELNGGISTETAGIYRKLGAAEKNLDTASEYFDRAAAIYELTGNIEEVPETLCEKGIMLMKGGSATREKTENAFQQVIDGYQENDYEKTDAIIMSYFHLSTLQDNLDSQIDYLLKADALTSNLSEERKDNITQALYYQIAFTCLFRGKYELSMEYCERLIELLGEPSDFGQKSMLAAAYQYSGACLAYLEESGEAEERLRKAIELYGDLGDGGPHTDTASAYAYLALAYAVRNKPEGDMVLEYGEKALSFYTNKSTITNIDLVYMEQIKLTLKAAYERTFPEREARSFEAWYEKIARLRATNYYYYTD